MTPITSVSWLGIAVRFRAAFLDRPRGLLGRVGGWSTFAICAMALLAADLAACAASASLVEAVRRVLPNAGPASAEATDVATFVLAASVMLCLGLRGRYGERLPFWSELRGLFAVGWLTGAMLAAASIALHLFAVFAPTIATLLLFPFVATVANRAAKIALSESGLWTINVLLLGEGPELAAIETALRATPSLGYCVVRRESPASLLALPAGARLRPLMARTGAPRVIVALGADHPLRRRIVDSAIGERVSFFLTPDLSCFEDISADGASFLSHDAILMLVRDARSRLVSRALKIALDVTLAALLLALLSPLFLLIALANLCGGGSVFYAHTRVGLGGRLFPCLKFRTMRVDGDQVLADALAADPALRREWESYRKLRNDPRVTSIGRLLRKTSLDELPQLINVLRLQMSLVGPRPIVESEMALFGEDIVHYFSARPGLTGLWQVSGRSNTSYTRRVKLDVWYVNNWTVWNDFAVLLKTIPAVLARDGAH